MLSKASGHANWIPQSREKGLSAYVAAKNQMLRGVCPEHQSEILRFAQDDKRSAQACPEGAARRDDERTLAPYGTGQTTRDDKRPVYALLVCLLCFSLTPRLRGATVSPLSGRGYTVLPAPQKVTLGARDFQFGPDWRLQLSGVQPNDVAVESLKDGLASRFGITLSSPGAVRTGARILRLALAPGSVEIGEAIRQLTDNRAALSEQAYKILLAEDSIVITANAPAGLFYGVQTFLQLLKPSSLPGNPGKAAESLGSATLRYMLPQGEIVDWPDLELRIIYWDDAHHLERLDALKQALRQAAFYKINGFAIKLEGHFQYKSAAPIVEPYALTPSELQELTDYALRYHIQLIPYLDGPAHVAFILKHPEYARLREFPESNYEFCATNPDTYQLLFGMYQDLLDANRSSKYFVLSTDEPYYVGLAKNAQCDEAGRAKELGSVGKLLAEFVTKTAGYLHDRGRTVIFWGEYPLKPEDISSLPPYLINGEVYGPEFDPLFKARGIGQLIYTSTEGEERLFPNYYPLPASRQERLHPAVAESGRVTEMFEHISFTSARQQADLMGAFVAGWADAGLHPETFWLGYATGPAVAWHPSAPEPQELMNSFYTLFYGPGAVQMGRLYQLMSEQARFWEDSWEPVPSSARTPLFGNSYQIFNPPRPEHDQTLPPLPVPSPEFLTLRQPTDWSQENSERLEKAARFLEQNDELLDLLMTNLRRVEFNRYNLEVFLSIARLYRQNLEMLLEMGRVSDFLKSAQAAAARGDAAPALASLDRALDTVERIRQERNTVLQDATATWYKTWLPRVAEANGRRYLDQVDDVKDHVPLRTIDMSYLVYRELLLPMEEWADEVRRIRNHYAQAHQLPVRNDKLEWKDTASRLSREQASEEE
jgi:hypothetical protein